MNKKSSIRGLMQISSLIILGITFLSSSRTLAQNVFESGLKLKMDSIINDNGVAKAAYQALLPNNSVQSIMTPSGWGGGNSTYIFGVIGGVFPALYTDPQKGDLIAAVGISGGNPAKYVNVSASLNITRVSELRDLSANIILSRQIFRGSSISVGGLQLFASPSVSDAPDATFYIAYSHASQTVRSRTTGYSGLGYTIGYGVGRFLYKSPQDILNGKGKFGTGFFANVSYEIFRQVNLNAEWSGLNLGFSSGVRPIRGSALTFGFGVYNLTKYSGDRIQYMGSLGLPIVLGRRLEGRKDKMDKSIRDKEFNRVTPPNFRGGENGLIMRN
jgi:hypothetical protein